MQCRTLFHVFGEASVNVYCLRILLVLMDCYGELEEGLKSTSRMVLDGKFPSGPGLRTSCFEGTRSGN